MVPRGAKIGAAVLIVLVIMVGASFFVVSETQQVVITQLGAPGWAADHRGGTSFQDSRSSRRRTFSKSA